MLGLIILGIILLILLIVIVSNVKVVPQAHAYVIERLGTYHVTWSTGLHVKIPFIDKISKKVSLHRQNFKESFIKRASNRLPSTACNHKR